MGEKERRRQEKKETQCVSEVTWRNTLGTLGLTSPLNPVEVFCFSVESVSKWVTPATVK